MARKERKAMPQEPKMVIREQKVCDHLMPEALFEPQVGFLQGYRKEKASHLRKEWEKAGNDWKRKNHLLSVLEDELDRIAGTGLLFTTNEQGEWGYWREL